MKLRTQILLFLFLFGLAPLVAAVVINLPLVLERMELFYHKAHLQNLRAELRDLDEHLASRNEMIRLLSKLPEPGAVLGTEEVEDYEQIDLARARYTQWINQILSDQLDITQILFLDRDGRERFWLERDRITLQWLPTTHAPYRPPEDFISAGLGVERGGVLVSPISIDPEGAATDPRRFMTLEMISPIVGSADSGTPETLGAVVMIIDVGGIARAYRGTLWVNDDGSYLQHDQTESARASAFSDFPGLADIFQAHKLALWEGAGGQVIWVPMFATESGEPLWVGRRVDPSPLAAFRAALVVRVLLIVLALIVAILLVARWAALRMERIGRELTEGVRSMLRNEKAVVFSWRGPQELRALGENLSQLAQSHARHSRALRQHARELEESNRYKSEFLANVSHELRTPLNSILLLSKMLSESRSRLTQEQLKQARVIHQAGSDLQSLIDNILDLSRIEAGHAVLHIERIELKPLLEDLLELVRPQFQQKGLALTLEIESGAPLALVSDREKVRQILKNFLSNSAKFTERGSVLMRLAGNSGPDALPCPVRITVSDTGIGIPKNKHSVIFEAFKQADGSTSRRFGGTGLGLTISRELAALMGGRIELHSEEGKGSSFSLLLPLEFDSERAAAQQVLVVEVEEQEEPTAPPVPEASFQGKCVLLVDNDVRHLLTLTPRLEAWGLRVTAAGDREEALDTLREEPECALVLTDVMMPQEEGYDTIRAIRREGGSRELPVIAFADDANSRARSREAGASDVVSTPVDMIQLKQVLEKYLP